MLHPITTLHGPWMDMKITWTRSKDHAVGLHIPLLILAHEVDGVKCHQFAQFAKISLVVGLPSDILELLEAPGMYPKL
jgi:hypothetical protein